LLMVGYLAVAVRVRVRRTPRKLRGALALERYVRVGRGVHSATIVDSGPVRSERSCGRGAAQVPGIPLAAIG
jgi:hypothetical protein